MSYIIASTITLLAYLAFYYYKKKDDDEKKREKIIDNVAFTHIKKI